MAASSFTCQEVRVSYFTEVCGGSPHGDGDLRVRHLPVSVQVEGSERTSDGGLLGGHVALELAEVHPPVPVAVVLPHDLRHIGVAIRQSQRAEGRLPASSAAFEVAGDASERLVWEFSTMMSNSQGIS